MEPKLDSGVKPTLSIEKLDICMGNLGLYWLK